MYKVLIVEDEEMIRKGIKYMVNWTKLDCVVVGEASNGVEGVEKIKQLLPDILLLDITMPIKNGIELLEETVDDFLFSTIIISGYDEFSYARQAITYGVDEYLLKPVEIDKLQKAIERAKKSLDVRREYKLYKKNIKTPNEIQLIHYELGERKIPKHMDLAIKYIKENYDKKITMNDLVNVTGMSATYLNNQFKSCTTYTFNEFLNRYRIQQAIERIKSGNDKISMIALDVGFSSYQYFVRVFKKYTKVLPSDFQYFYQNKYLT